MEPEQRKQPFLEAYAVPILIVFVALGALALQSPRAAQSTDIVIVPDDGVVLSLVWGDIGKQLVESGAIDRSKWVSLYSLLSEEEKRLLDGNSSERMRITQENAPYLLNLFWAFGLANKNPILEDKTEMMNPEYERAGGFASTGGWTLARGDPMEHYNKHELVSLTPQQQKLVEKISRGIYRPCCDNSTHFPDCSHGMAMLGLLELLASQGASEERMWDAALAANSYWFPEAYQTIALYKQRKGVAWEDVSSQEVLGYDYSSASGFALVAADVARRSESDASCGV